MLSNVVCYVGRHHIGLLVLFVALTGTAYAASLPRNSVGTAQLRKDAVTTTKVRNRSLRAIDFAAGQLPAGPAGPRGATGATGPAGPAGPQGPAGLNAFGALNYVSAGPFDNPANSQSGGAVTCPAGQHPTGGGVITESTTPGEQSINSTSAFPSSGVAGDAPDSWGASVDNTTATSLSFFVFAVCAPAAQVTSDFKAKGTPAKK